MRIGSNTEEFYIEDCMGCQVLVNCWVGKVCYVRYVAVLFFDGVHFSKFSDEILKPP